KAKDKFTRHWAWLSGIFLYMSVDEGATLHESFTGPVNKLFNTLPGYLGFSWVIPYLIFVAIAAIAYTKFFLELDKKTRNGFLLAGVLFVVGAVGMEMVASQIIHWGWDIRYYLAAPFVEELLEMSAIALFIIVLLQYVQEKTAEIRLVIKA